MGCVSWAFGRLIWFVHGVGFHTPHILEKYIFTDDIHYPDNEKISRLCTVIVFSACLVSAVKGTFRNLGPLIVQLTRFFFWFVYLILAFSVCMIYSLKADGTYALAVKDDSQVLEDYIVEYMSSKTKNTLQWLLSQLE